MQTQGKVWVKKKAEPAYANIVRLLLWIGIVGAICGEGLSIYEQ